MNNLAGIGLVALSLLATTVNSAFADDGAASCESRVAQWLDPASGAVLAPRALFDDLAAARVVLLGEAHDNQTHHRWQYYMLSVLHSRNTNMVIGLEMLPRRVQPTLDAWSTGKLGESEFLEQSGWLDLWGYDADLYLPLLHFARLNRVPTIALNIDRELVSKVGRQGWQSLDQEQRMGLSDPAPASDEYRRSLARLYAYKLELRDHGGDHNLAEAEAEAEAEADIDEILQLEEFAHFVDAQLTWDRAMAEAIAAALARDADALVVGIVGRGHLEHGYGIPWQLADMGIEEVRVLLPLDADDDCDALPKNFASAVFVVDAEPEAVEARGPLLGVMIEDSEQGVRVMEVVAGSVAAGAGIKTGDLIQTAAGFEVSSTSELIAVVRRQAPGTWLPLRVLRDDQSRELIARFPQNFE
ncbi:MAG: PDZ domain-containing protein [Gammaproteobacteria bacterium]|nr:PDZ domain-containing protein [Gammaproteobacteria bacterium]